MDPEDFLIGQYTLQIQEILALVFSEQLFRRQRRRLRAINNMTEGEIVALLEIVALIQAGRRPRRRLWMRVRSAEFWDVVMLHFTPEDWMERFRVSQSTFQYVCEMLRQRLEPQEAFLISRPPISSEKQVAVALFYLASCCEYRTVGDIFGIHKTSVWRCVHRVVNAINDILLPIWIQMPGDAECQQIATAFENKSHIPQIIGCIDGSHIPVRAPTNGYRDYVNRKGWTSIVLQAVVDNKYLFRNINCCTPGASHDASVFRRSGLYENSRDLIPQSSKNINGIDIPYMIIGDPAYPLLSWLLKGYTRIRPLTALEDSFNVHLSSARVAVEIAFGRLKSRWRTVQKRIDLDYRCAPNIVAACCTLHNIIETMDNNFNGTWMNEIRDTDRQFPQPEQPDNENQPHPQPAVVRDTLKNYLNRFPLRRSYRR